MDMKGIGLAGLMLCGGGAQAAGFALIEQNASGLGNAYAGQAAAAEDASTIFFNPAGLTELEGRQVAAAVHYIRPSAEFSGSATINGAPSPISGNGGDAGMPAFVPNFYYAMAIRPGLKFGLGVNAPFGLATEYDVPWAGMSQALKSDVKTININPALAWKASDAVSIGFGLDWQRMEATLTSSASPVVPVEARMEGEDGGSWGWNTGALFQLGEATRLGFAYRSRIEHNLEGTLNLLGPIKADITLPDTASLSLFHKLNGQWDLLADATWTGWSSFDKLEVRSALNPAIIATSVTENWQDAWRFSVGANWHMNDQWTWRFGVAFDQTPVPDAAHRTPRIPDEDRTWLALGGQYRFSKQGRIDVGYAHLFVKDAEIAHCEPETVCPAFGVSLTGNYDNAVDILSVQYTHTF